MPPPPLLLASPHSCGLPWRAWRPEVRPQGAYPCGVTTRSHPTRRRRSLLAIALLSVVALLAGCATSGASSVDQPRDGRAGLQLSGTLDGRQVAVSHGAPQLVIGDCDPTTPPDTDVCAISNTIGGTVFVLSFENPDVLVAGETLEVASSPCRGPACDGITEHAVVDVQVGDGDRMRATDGEVRVEAADEFRRYAGEVHLNFDEGHLSGHFDLVPRRD